MADPALSRLADSYDLQSAELQTLQGHRVREILLVASLYDSYTLSEGGHLAELIIGEYHNLYLSGPPRITRVSTRSEALEMLRRKRCDLVITLAQPAEMTATEFGRAVKTLDADLPVYLVAYNMQELRAQEGDYLDIEGIDRTFLWRGDVRLFLAIIKLVEDRLNLEHDTRVGDVLSLILIEDSLPFYSSYLPMLFDELVKQTEALIEEEVNLAQRLTRRRMRPKVLLASSYEEGWSLYEKLRETVLCVVTDVRFPRGGEVDPEAGLKLLKSIRAVDSDVPLLLQSSERRYEQAAEVFGAAFLHKESPTLHKDFRQFMLQQLGFGDFVFRMPDGREVARASNVDEMLAALATVPAAALNYHAARNHFSSWLMARTEYRLATILRRLRVSDFANVEDMRGFLLKTWSSIREQKHRGQVADFQAARPDTVSMFFRIGGGSLGGKGRGLAFVHELLSRGRLDEYSDQVRIVVPHCAVIGTDVFDSYLRANDLLDFALHEEDDEALLSRFQQAALPDDVVSDLRAFLRQVDYPLAVRSSSLLEDSRYLPAAGVYPTHMLPNADPDVDKRLDILLRAIKHVFASTFFRAAKAYHQATTSRVEEEKMAVVVQQVIGRRHEDVLYPVLSGTARSYNFYPVRDMKPEEGVATVALGLGKTVVEGERALRFSPVHPQWLPQFSTPADILENAQRQFWALDMSRLPSFASPAADANLVQLDLAAARRHGTLWPVASVYSPDNDAVYDGLSRPGVPLVTFAPILKHELFPLAKVIRLLLEVSTLGMAGPVEIEFAADIEPERASPQQIGFLQIRPLVRHGGPAKVDLGALANEDMLVRASHVLGGGRDTGIRDIVMVRRDVFDRARTVEIAADIAQMNDILQRHGRGYLLIGPGRWGTADPWMGIPVKWFQIAGARAILECDLDDLVVEPSQGTHFFHNISSQGISYFTVGGHLGGTIDWAWLAGLAPAQESAWVRRYELDEPLEVVIDGHVGEGAILKRSRDGSGAAGA